VIDLEPTIADAWEVARSAWPGIDVPLPQFAEHVRARLATPTVDALHGLDTVDLYLACGCLHDSAGARDVFSRTVLAAVGSFVKRFDSSPAFADEVRQHLAEKLLLGTSGTGARIGDYNGRGPLGAWVRVVAVRAALDLLAAQSPARAAAQGDALHEAVEGMHQGSDPMLAYLRERYLPAYRDAIRAALAGLTSQQRNVLRLQLVSRLTTEKIGAMFHVNQSTVVRWLANARSEIRARAEATLVASLKVSPDELASLTRLILSRLDLSIVDVLVSTPPG
jgi:RNA polymerase sigma-70 factor (ECF subfamily)